MIFQPVVMYLKSKKVPNYIIVPLIGGVTLLFIYGIYSIMSDAYSDLMMNRDFLVERLTFKINATAESINETFGTRLDTDTKLIDYINLLSSDNAKSFASALGSFTGSFFIFAVYYFFLLSGISNYKVYLKYVSGEIQDGDILSNYETVQRSIYSYIIIKSGVSIATGILVYLVCLSFGVQFAILWGFVAFVLNFIPSLGSIAGSILPVIMSFIQFDSLNTVFLVLIFVGVSQFVMGNIVEPRLLGHRLRLNTPTVIFGLVFWGYLWGVPGMMVCIPLLVMIKLIFEQFPSLRIVARIMGSPGRGKN